MYLHKCIARGVALTFAAAAFAACGGDSTSPLDLDPESFEQLGADIAANVEVSALQLTADGAQDYDFVAAFQMDSPRSQQVLGPAANVLPVRQIVDEVCGEPSQEVPTDSDADGVPDNLTITFALPACRDETESGVTEVTGLFRISDPTPGTAGFAMNFGMDDLRVSIQDQEFSLLTRFDGSGSVSASETGLAQTQDWFFSVTSDDITGSASIDWTATFAGEGITAGEPLPDGTYSPNGTFVYRVGNQQSAFSVTTVEALQYSAACAAQIGEMADTPFSAGVLRVAFSGQEGQGFVQVSYEDCLPATVVYVAALD